MKCAICKIELFTVNNLTGKIIGSGMAIAGQEAKWACVDPACVAAMKTAAALELELEEPCFHNWVWQPCDERGNFPHWLCKMCHVRVGRVGNEPPPPEDERKRKR